METDYKALCLELFGTTDVDKLREIAGKINNSRSAGRKKLLNQENLAEINEMLSRGIAVDEIAARYSTSRQVISKYINAKPAPGYTMRISYMYRANICTLIDVNFIEQKIKIQNRTADMLHRAFGVIEEPTWDDFENFLRDRCFPATRGNKKELIKELGLQSFDPLMITEKTAGRMAEDSLWIKFNYYPMERGTINA